MLLALGTAVLASVVPYTLELAALRRAPRRVFGTLLSLEPAVAALAGLVLLGQRVPAAAAGAIALVILASAGATVEPGRTEPGGLANRLRRHRRRGQPRLAGLDHERVVEGVPGLGHVRRRGRLVTGLVPHVVDDERAGDAELRVGVEHRVVVAVQLRGDRLEAGLVDHRVDVRRAERVPLERGEQVAGRAARRYRVAGRLDAAEREGTVLIGDEAAAQVPLGLVRVLVLVQAVRRGVPDVDLGAGHRVAVGVHHRACEEQRRPGVGERTIESPLRITGAPCRQNGPSRFADVGCSSVPLFIRQTSVDRPRLPAISRTSLWLGVVSWPSLATMLMLASNSASVSRTSLAKSCRWRMSAWTTSRNRGSSGRPVSASTASVSCISSLMIMCVSCPAARRGCSSRRMPVCG